MLKMEHLAFRYGARSEPVLKDVSMELAPGEIGILLGKNGSGKTTLFKNILGICNPQQGTITWDGENLLKMSGRKRASCIAYVPQKIEFGALSVFDSVLLGRIAYFGMRPGKEDVEITERILAEMGLESYAGRDVDRLSGGERQKVAIARALVQEPKLLIFDEPTGNLDIANEQLILEEAARLAREKQIAVLSSLHDLNQAMHFGDRFFFLKDGAIRYTGGTETFTQEIIYDIFDIQVRIIEYEKETIILGGKKHEI